MNTFNNIILLFLVVLVGCKKPFQEAPETALALPIETQKTDKPLVFIAGFDEGDNTYYANAKNYFKNQNVTLVEHLFSINDIIQWLNTNSQNKTFNNIHIVSHSNAWRGMSLKTHETGERITTKSLQLAKQEHKIAAIQNGISNNTKIIFHSCGLGENQALLQELKQTFTGTKTPKIYASSYFNIFGGKYADHYLAKPYYGFYPTAESPGPLQLSKAFKKRYPNTNINWFKALKTRQESNVGAIYSYKFNIPIDWEFTFDDPNDIPKLKDRNAIMNWIVESPELSDVLYNLNIPIEKYRWRSKIKGNTLIINGKTTVLCVLEPVMDNGNNEYRNADLEDTLLYNSL